ncbi:hypothetical protein DL769_000985 [Monosporascus sp. CRB-8-3]|nr:hypothetical protein DL769_000985 [Monosporascus sp. CRB-8-3]
MSDTDGHHPKGAIDPHLYAPEGANDETRVVIKGAKLEVLSVLVYSSGPGALRTKEVPPQCITIEYWRSDITAAVWVTVFLAIVCIVPIFGVRGYGEVESVLSMIKITACRLSRNYLLRDPGTFKNGFNGFTGVFVIAAFSFGATELVGLAATESQNPRKAIHLATKRVFFRIVFFYIANLFILGLILPSTDTRLTEAPGANLKASPFVLAIENAGVRILASIFNAVVTISVISVAGSCTFGSTRTMQAMARRGMAPKILAYVDKAGRPLWYVVIQPAFGLLGYIGAVPDGITGFNWLLAVSGRSYFFVCGSCCLAHIRFRLAWQHHGYNLKRLPYRPPLGAWGSVVGLSLNIVRLIATFYNSLYPTADATPDAEAFFQGYMAAPIVISSSTCSGRAGGDRADEREDVG